MKVQVCSCSDFSRFAVAATQATLLVAEGLAKASKHTLPERKAQHGRQDEPGLLHPEDTGDFDGVHSGAPAESITRGDRAPQRVSLESAVPAVMTVAVRHRLDSRVLLLPRQS